MKKINIDLIVGIFLIIGFLAFGYISLKLGEFSILSLKEEYRLMADFDNVSGLKSGAVLEIAGVEVGRVADITLNENYRARVHMLVRQDVEISEDAIASVKTRGIIGDKYLRILQGGSEDMLQEGDLITETESTVDLEELVSKYIFGDV